MPTFELCLLFLMGGLAWLWSDSMQAHAIGVQAVKKACEEEGLQLLDDTIALRSVKPQRNEEGWMSLARVYQFEYSNTGDNRRRGSVHLIGHHVVMLNLGLRLVSSSTTLH